MPRAGVAFLLAQVGAHAADRFATRIAEINLTPPLAGVMRLIALTPGRSQQSLANELGMLPSKVVTLVDDLERRGLVERQRNPDDRRLYALHLTRHGKQFLARIRDVADAHENDLVGSLADTERDQLAALLTRIAAQQELTPGVHPGYRHLGSRPSSPAVETTEPTKCGPP